MTQSARLAQLVNELTQVRVQSYSLEVQLHSWADSLTQASSFQGRLVISCGCNVPGFALPLLV